jgi:16S rRNA (guanine527-N7)-methyltransferase
VGAIGGLTDALLAAQQLGLLGARPVADAVSHAREFVKALETMRAPTDGEASGSGPTKERLTVVDMGSGGGLPGLVIATDRPDLAVTLVDRRQKCADFLERAVAALGLGGRVMVRCCDVTALIGALDQFDAVTARGFGPPTATLRAAARLVRSGGRIVISEPPEGDRWISGDVQRLGLTQRREGAVAVFTHATS